MSYFGRKPQAGVRNRYYDDLVAMARDIDTLILVIPGGPATANLVNAAVLDALGPRGILINMARGSVVDEAALIAALRARKILRAGLDVYVGEPNINPAFLELDNVTLLPHVGSASIHTREPDGPAGGRQPRRLRRRQAAQDAGRRDPVPGLVAPVSRSRPSRRTREGPGRSVRGPAMVCLNCACGDRLLERCRLSHRVKW